MNKKKRIFDLIFIVIAAIILSVLVEYGLIEKYIGFVLIPILIAYYLGQFVERKTRAKSE
jgi:predicted membrane protein